jgi:hypothetical protein
MVNTDGVVFTATMALVIARPDTRTRRYAVWVDFNYGGAKTDGVGVGPRWSTGAACIRGEELYSHAADDAPPGAADNDFDTSELRNVAYDPKFAEVRAVLLRRIQEEWPESRG